MGWGRTYDGGGGGEKRQVREEIAPGKERGSGSEAGADGMCGVGLEEGLRGIGRQSGPGRRL